MNNFTKNNSLRIKNALLYGAGSAVLSRILTLLTTVVLSQVLGKYFFGQYSYLNSTLTLFLTISATGFSATLVRYIPIYKEKLEDLADLVNLIKSISYIILFLLSVSLFVYANEISIYLTGSNDIEKYFLLLAIAIIFSSLSSIQGNLLLGFENYKIIAVGEVIYCIVYLVSSFILSILYGLTGAMIAMVITYFVKWIYLYYKSKHLSPYKVPSYKKIKKFESELTSFTIPAIISSLLVLPVNWINNSILVKHNSFNDLSIVFIGLQWVAIITYVAIQLGNLRPIYTTMFDSKDYVGLKRLFIKTTISSIVVISPVVLFCVFFSKYILNIYGGVFLADKSTFIIFLLVSIIITVQSQVGTLLQSLGKMWIGLLLNFIWGTIFIISFWNLKDLGSLGYSISYALAYFIHAILSLSVCVLLWKVYK